MRVLAVDPGGQRFGLAIGDDVTSVTTPLEVVANRGRDRAVDAVVDAARRHRADVVVIGLPTTADGDETPACARSHALAEALAALGITVVLQPEHLTTDEARRRARAAGRRRDEPVDDLAAQIILDDYLSLSARSAAARRSC